MILLVCLISLGQSSVVLAIPFAPMPERTHANDQLVVRISAYGGVVWGTVDIGYRIGKTIKSMGVCKRRTCKYRPPPGVTMVLVEHPRHAKTWRFRSWIVHNGGRLTHVSSTTLRFKIRSHLFDNANLFKARVKANYYYPYD